MDDTQPQTRIKGKLRALGQSSRLMRDHYLELHAAAGRGEPPIAWCSSVGPAELLRGMGFLVYFPENHAAMLGAMRRASSLMVAANRLGYAPDICAYLRSDIGAFIENESALTGIAAELTTPPRPNVLVYNTNQCRDIKDWFSWYGRHFGVPCIGVETPRNIDAVSKAHVRSVSRQLRELVPTLEGIAGRKLDSHLFEHTVSLSRACSDTWGEVLDRAARRPSPLSFFNGLLLMGPAVVARGTQAAVDFYRTVTEELDRRVDAGIGAIRRERHRIYWEGMPVWGKIGELNRLFSRLEACVTASTYCHSWVFDALDPKDPFDSMARAYTALFIVRSDAAKERYIEAMLNRFAIDGIVFHDAKTCPNNTNSRYGMPARLAERLGIPSTTIQSDHMDDALFHSGRVTTQLEAFFEALNGM